FFSSLIGARIDLGTARGRMIQVGVSVISGLIVYLGAIILFRVEEVREALAMAGSFFKKNLGGVR
ncbi:MAG: hypothetical protein ACYC21_16080, partial [Eubacteriales bacterium]